MSGSASHCARLVREADWDRYVSCLFAPDGQRQKLFALYAFNIEIWRIADAVSEPQIGLIRQQWWSDTLTSGAAGHPVAEAVFAAGLPRQPLKSLIAAREFDLFDDPMPDLEALEGYLGETSSVLIQLAAMILDPPAASKAAQAAGLAGVAYGLARLLLTFRSDPNRYRKFIPKDHLARAGEQGALTELAAHARKRLEEARAAADGLPEELLPAFLPASLTGLYLDRTARGRTSPPSQFRRQLTLWWAARNDRF